MNEQTKTAIQSDIESNPVVLYMKGNKTFPQCGYSAKVVEILNQHRVDFESRNVLSDPNLRQGIKDFSDWPFFPQLYVRGKFVGGRDIVLEMHENGQLANLLSSDASSSA